MRNRASLRKIVPVVQAHNLVHVQDKNVFQGADCARSQLDRAVRQVRAEPRPGKANRAGHRAGQADRGVLQSETRPGTQADKGVLQSEAGHRNHADRGVGVDKDTLQAEAVLRAGAELADPGLLGVLRARPGTQADGTDSGLGQNTVRAGPDHTRVPVSPRGGSSPGSPRGDRSGSGRPSLNSLSPLQEGGRKCIPCRV